MPTWCQKGRKQKSVLSGFGDVCIHLFMQVWGKTKKKHVRVTTGGDGLWSLLVKEMPFFFFFLLIEIISGLWFADEKSVFLHRGKWQLQCCKVREPWELQAGGLQIHYIASGGGGVWVSELYKGAVGVCLCGLDVEVGRSHLFLTVVCKCEDCLFLQGAHVSVSGYLSLWLNRWAFFAWDPDSRSATQLTVVRLTVHNMQSVVQVQIHCGWMLTFRSTFSVIIQWFCFTIATWRKPLKTVLFALKMCRNAGCLRLKTKKFYIKAALIKNDKTNNTV